MHQRLAHFLHAHVDNAQKRMVNTSNGVEKKSHNFWIDWISDTHSQSHTHLQSLVSLRCLHSSLIRALAAHSICTADNSVLGSGLVDLQSFHINS